MKSGVVNSDSPRKVASDAVAVSDSNPSGSGGGRHLARSDSQPSTLRSQPLSIPDHELIRCIGRGAYGEVWLARHARLGTLRAVKIVRHDQFDHARPFQREFDGIRRYEPISRGHPNLVAILHVGGTDDCFFYVMELADAAEPCSEDGGLRIENRTNAQSAPCHPPSSILDPHSYAPHTLRSELKAHGPLPIDRCLEIALALAGALAHLHARGLVHRDVKPSNVIFVDGVAKLADIGLVAAVSDSRSFVGTEGYIPPEGPGAPSADCYALGKLLYELSTGHDRTAWPEPPAGLATRPDRERLLELNAILHRACAPDPRERYRNAEEMQTELELLQRGQSVKGKRAWEQRLAIGKKVGLVSAVIGVLTVLGWWLLKDFDVSRHGSQGSQRAELPAMAGTKNLEAYKLYEKARVCFRQFTIDGEKLAREYLNEAIKLDPNFVDAYALLFQGYVNSWALPDDEINAGHRATAKKLMELSPNSAEAQYAGARVKFNLELEFAEAEKGFQRAIASNPSYALAHASYGCFLEHMGRCEEARAELRRSDDLDPGFPGTEQLLVPT